VGGVTLVATCRSDEAPLEPHVAGWLAHMRGGREVEEIRLSPLSREETAGQIAELLGGPPPRRVADQLYARAEGNPFFTDQLVAASVAGAGQAGPPGPPPPPPAPPGRRGGRGPPAGPAGPAGGGRAPGPAPARPAP